MFSEYVNCPTCGCEFVHHDGVDVYERTEDSHSGTRVRVRGVDAPTRDRQSPHCLPRGPEVSVDSTLDGNPSARRQGVSIRFWCERCAQRFTLSVAQHKGVTLLELKPDVQPTASVSLAAFLQAHGTT